MDRTPLASSSALELLAGDSVLRATSTFWDKAVVVEVVVAASDDDAGGGGGRPPLGPLTPLSNRRTGLSALLMWGMLNSGGGGWV